jgi:hypothetical protein
MSAQPAELTAAAETPQGIGSSLTARNVAAAPAIHEMFVNTLGVSTGWYTATDAADAAASG